MRIRSVVAHVAAVLAVHAAGATPAFAQVADFETQPAFSCPSNSVVDGGLRFSNDFVFCFYSETQPADWPFVPTSTVMGSGFSPTRVERVDGAPFALYSADLSAGVYSQPGTITVTGFFSGGGSISQDVDLIFGFQTYNFNWANLEYVSFGQLPSDGYVGFDNVTYDAATVVPEPATLALLVPGAMAIFFVRRRRTR